MDIIVFMSMLLQDTLSNTIMVIPFLMVATKCCFLNFYLVE